MSGRAEEIELEQKETPVISKKTGKPKRQLSEKQQEILKVARETWNDKRRELKAQKALVVNERKEKFKKDTEIVETEMNKLKLQVEEQIKKDYEEKLKTIQEEYEIKLNDKERKEKLIQKYKKKPKKVVEYYAESTDADTETDMEETIKQPKRIVKTIPKKEPEKEPERPVSISPSDFFIKRQTFDPNASSLNASINPFNNPFNRF